MRTWFVALAATAWIIVVAAGVFLFIDIGFCFLPSDPSLRNRVLCSTAGTTGSIDFVTLVVGIPVLILIDYAARNPVWFQKPLTTRVMYFWTTITIIVILLFLSYLVPAVLLPILVLVWVGVGLAWTALFITRAKSHRPSHNSGRN